MKIHGKKIEGVNIETIVIPRGDDVIIFRAQAVLDMAEFNRLCPVPQAPKILKKGGQISFDTDDAGYKAAVSTYGNKRFAYMLIKSLEATPGLEWETIKLGDPNTWNNYETELKDSGFNYVEVQYIEQGILAANALSETKIEEARKRFLAGEQAQQSESSFLTGDPKNTPSGELANDLESDRRALEPSHGTT